MGEHHVIYRHIYSHHIYQRWLLYLVVIRAFMRWEGQEAGWPPSSSFCGYSYSRKGKHLNESTTALNQPGALFNAMLAFPSAQRKKDTCWRISLCCDKLWESSKQRKTKHKIEVPGVGTEKKNNTTTPPSKRSRVWEFRVLVWEIVQARGLGLATLFQERTTQNDTSDNTPQDEAKGILQLTYKRPTKTCTKMPENIRKFKYKFINKWDNDDSLRPPY